MGRIVVGIDASPGADAALEWACEEAALRGDTVEVVAAYAGCGEPADQLMAMDPVHEPARQEAVDRLGRALEGPTVTDGVDIEPLVIDDDPARALVRQAEGADLLVVGAPERGALSGWLLGSVSEHCRQHAPCPVVVVPAR